MKRSGPSERETELGRGGGRRKHTRGKGDAELRESRLGLLQGWTVILRDAVMADAVLSVA